MVLIEQVQCVRFTVTAVVDSKAGRHLHRFRLEPRAIPTRSQLLAMTCSGQ
jgi:hypothetical protein